MMMIGSDDTHTDEIESRIIELHDNGTESVGHLTINMFATSEHDSLLSFAWNIFPHNICKYECSCFK